MPPSSWSQNKPRELQQAELLGVAGGFMLVAWKLVTSQMITFFMVTAAISAGPADSSSQLLSAEPPGLNRDRFLPVRHSSYTWTLCTLDTENSSYIWTRCTPDTEFILHMKALHIRH
jgi:hypothetical protein